MRELLIRFVGIPMLMLLELMLYRAFFPTFKVVYFAAANAKSGRWIGTELTTIV